MKPSSAPSENFTEQGAELIKLAQQLFMADMSKDVNLKLRERALKILDELSDEERRKAYSAAINEHVRLEIQFQAAQKDKAGVNLATAGPLCEAGPVVVDEGQIRKALGGREPNEFERDAIAIRADAMACGRSVVATIAACEVFGRGVIRQEVKEILGR